MCLNFFRSDKSEEKAKEEEQIEDSLKTDKAPIIIPESEEELLQHVSEYLKEANESAQIGSLPSLLGTSVEKTCVTFSCVHLHFL